MTMIVTDRGDNKRRARTKITKAKEEWHCHSLNEGYRIVSNPDFLSFSVRVSLYLCMYKFLLPRHHYPAHPVSHGFGSKAEPDHLSHHSS